MNALSSRTINYQLRYHAIQEQFYHKYNIERKRIDDVFEELEQEFYIKERSIKRILSLKLISKEQLSNAQRRRFLKHA
ncbi:hypothetical protein [Algivirga pacifica]|uniref:Transposase n=1 Tax=Algivirga pacifica TaxID=1162670 RepID=A0ABP9D3A1_9BACT